MDISDLMNEFSHGRTMAETASFLCRDEDEVIIVSKGNHDRVVE
jgi:hypothetical protein